MNLQQSLTASGQPLQNFQVAAGDRDQLQQVWCSLATAPRT